MGPVSPSHGSRRHCGGWGRGTLGGADREGVQRQPNEWFTTEHRVAQLEAAKRAGNVVSLDHATLSDPAKCVGPGPHPPSWAQHARRTPWEEGAPPTGGCRGQRRDGGVNGAGWEGGGGGLMGRGRPSPPAVCLSSGRAVPPLSRGASLIEELSSVAAGGPWGASSDLPMSTGALLETAASAVSSLELSTAGGSAVEKMAPRPHMEHTPGAVRVCM